MSSLNTNLSLKINDLLEDIKKQKLHYAYSLIVPLYEHVQCIALNSDSALGHVFDQLDVHVGDSEKRLIRKAIRAIVVQFNAKAVSIIIGNHSRLRIPPGMIEAIADHEKAPCIIWREGEH